MFKPGEKETDWQDTDIEEALKKVIEITKISYSKIYNDRSFWHCFYKGGIQGAIYYIDSYK
jgi:hypothetical protein